jgi:hypothetical protein
LFIDIVLAVEAWSSPHLSRTQSPR